MINFSKDAIKKRWHRINACAKKIGACYDEVVRAPESGINEDNIMEKAHKLYFNEEGLKCILMEH